MDIKLLALDMDGTTYHAMGEIVESNIKPLQQAIAQGVDVAIVTGRPVLAPQNKLIEHGIVGDKTVIIGCNGGCIYDLKQKRVIDSNPIDTQLADKAFALAKRPEFAGTLIWGYVDDLEHVVLGIGDATDPNQIQYPLFKHEMGLFEGKYLMHKDVEGINYKYFKLLAFNAKPGFVEALREAGFEAYSSKGTDVEINAPGVNKRFAVQWLSENWNVPIENIMSIGDGANDLPMIEYAGIGVAMKNSIQEIKDIAQIYIDKTNDEGAVGEIIKQYVLKK